MTMIKLMVIFYALISPLLPGWLYQQSAPCNWRISQWMPMPVPLNLAVVSKATAFINAGNGTAQMLKGRQGRLPWEAFWIFSNAGVRKTKNTVWTRCYFWPSYPCTECEGAPHASVCSAACVAQVESCWWRCSAADVGTDTLLLIKPLINMSGLLCCSLQC